eukprot:6201762-Pleurochrysis_carterae.AAC.1
MSVSTRNYAHTHTCAHVTTLMHTGMYPAHPGDNELDQAHARMHAFTNRSSSLCVSTLGPRILALFYERRLRRLHSDPIFRFGAALHAGGAIL